VLLAFFYFGVVVSGIVLCLDSCVAFLEPQEVISKKIADEEPQEVASKITMDEEPQNTVEEEQEILAA